MQVAGVRFAKAGRRNRARAIACLLSALATPALVIGASTRPAYAQAAQAERQYKVDAQLPTKFQEALKNTTKFGYNAKTSKLTVDGQSRDVVTTEIGWADDGIDSGTFAFAPGRAVQGDAWQHLNSGADADWPKFVAALKKVAVKRDNWSFVVLRYAPAAAGNPAALVVPAPIHALAGWDDGTGYKFDLAMPSSFTEALMDRSKAGYNAKTETIMVNGQPRDIVTTNIAWTRNATTGQEGIYEGIFAFSVFRAVDQGGWHGIGLKDDPEWQKIAAALDKGAVKTADGWRFVAVRYVLAKDAGNQAFSAPYSEPRLAKWGIDTRLAGFKVKVAKLSEVTRPGEYFPNARVPSNLASVQQAMLDYGNKERHTVGFRSVVGAKVATDLESKPSTIKNLEGKDERVLTQPDMRLDEKLNKTAQWFAEALATGNGKVHTGLAAWTDASGKMAKMTEMGDRAAYFGAPSDWNIAEIAAPEWDAGDSPYNWMSGDTHYRWYFGVDGIYPEIGYGAAQDAKGKWHYVGVAHRVPPPTATAAK